MWSVTEQNHLHYPAVMFHCSGLVHWWLPTHFCGPLLLRRVISCCLYLLGGKKVLAVQLFYKKKKTFPLISSLFQPAYINLMFPFPSFSAVSERYCVMLVRSTFALIFLPPFCLTFRCCRLSALAALHVLVLFVQLYFYYFTEPNHSCSLTFTFFAHSLLCCCVVCVKILTLTNLKLFQYRGNNFDPFFL